MPSSSSNPLSRAVDIAPTGNTPGLLDPRAHAEFLRDLDASLTAGMATYPDEITAALTSTPIRHRRTVQIDSSAKKRTVEDDNVVDLESHRERLQRKVAKRRAAALAANGVTPDVAAKLGATLARAEEIAQETSRPVPRRYSRRRIAAAAALVVASAALAVGNYNAQHPGNAPLGTPSAAASVDAGANPIGALSRLTSGTNVKNAPVEVRYNGKVVGFARRLQDDNGVERVGIAYNESGCAYLGPFYKNQSGTPQAIVLEGAAARKFFQLGGNFSQTGLPVTDSQSLPRASAFLTSQGRVVTIDAGSLAISKAASTATSRAVAPTLC